MVFMREDRHISSWPVLRRLSPLFTLLLVGLLLFLSSCGSTVQTKTVTHPRVTPVATSSSAHTNVAATVLNYYRQQVMLQQRLGPNGWMWNVALPADRLVVYYGNPFSSAMGPIGAYNDDDLLARLRQQAQAYAQLDPTHPVIPALDYVTPVAQDSPMANGTWTARMPDDSIEHYRNLANSNHMLFFMDMQVAHSSVQDEVNAEWSFLEQPGVDLALDPEFDLSTGGIPDVNLGHMTADEINWVIDKLSNLVMTQNLPPKILIIHQFRESMLPDWQNIKVEPGVELVTAVDGFGSPAEKIVDYNIFDKQQLIQYPGFKLFYDLDNPLMSPADVLALEPPPLMVMYQ
ncbi:MAG TPA: hypothetical protein VNE38_21285 [Ktedonobacteraceae bacterium]|nr:hypothetical protein [Ktedonobacteraceae bacterium]